MGDVGDDLPAQDIQPLQGQPQFPDGLGQLSELVPAFQIRANRKVVFGQLVHRTFDLKDGTGKLSGQDCGQHRCDAGQKNAQNDELGTVQV